MARLRHRFTTAVFGVGLTRVAGAIGGIFAARLLGPSEKGDLAALVLVGMVLGQLAGAGVEYWVQREVARRGEVGPAVVRVVRNQVLVGTVVSVLTLVVATAVGAPVQSAAALAVYVFAWNLSMTWLAVPVGLHRSARVGVASLVGGLAYMVGVGVLLWAGDGNVALVLGLAAAGSAVVAIVARRPGHWRSVDPDAEEPTDMLAVWRFGAPNAIGEVITIGMARLDVALVLVLASSSAAGLYSVAASYAEVLWVLPAGASQVLLPQVAAHASSESTAVLSRVTTMVMVPAGIAAAVVAPLVVPLLFGASFRDAVSAVPLLCLAAVLLGIWRIVVSDIVGRGSSTVRVTSSFVGLLVMVVSDLLLIPVWGIAGASLGAVLGYGAALVLAATKWAMVAERPVLDLFRGPIPGLGSRWR